MSHIRENNHALMTPTSAASMGSASNNVTTTSSGGKRDKRRQTIANRIMQISTMFEEERDLQYRDMLHNLQSTLSSLHSGRNTEFLDELTDMEERRDEELVRLNLWEKYQIERVEEEYQREVESANQDYNKMILNVKDRLLVRLENQRKRLREEKAYLDIANENNLFLNGNDSSYGGNNTNGKKGQQQNQQEGTYYYYHSSRHRHHNNYNLHPNGGGAGAGGTGGYFSSTVGYGSNGEVSTGIAGTDRAGGPGSITDLGLASERRSLRRREQVTASAFEEMSGLSTGAVSGGERGGGYGSGGGRTRRQTAAAAALSGDDGGGYSDRDGNKLGGITDGGGHGTGGYGSGYGGYGSGVGSGVTGLGFGTETGGGTNGGSGRSGNQGGRTSKSYQAPAALKNEEAIEDLNILRSAISSLKRQRVD